MRKFLTLFTATLAVVISTPPRADIPINLLESPRPGEIVAAAAITPLSSVEYKGKVVSAVGPAGDISIKTDLKLEGKNISLSGAYGLSNTSGIFAAGIFFVDTEAEWNSAGSKVAGDMDGQDLVIGGYSSVNLLEKTETMVWGQYRMIDWSVDGAMGDVDVEGSEIIVGLIGISRRDSGLKLFAGPEYVISTDIETNSVDVDIPNLNGSVKGESDKRENSFGLRIGFSKPLKNSDMYIYGSAALMHQQSFFIGLSTTL